MSLDDSKPPERHSEEHIVRSWLVTHGEEAMTRPKDGGPGMPYRKIEIEEYPTALNALIQSFLKNGYKEDDLDSVVLVKMIAKKMTPMVTDTHKLEKWHAAISSIWYHFIDKEFADSSILAPPKDYPKEPPKARLAPEESDSTYVPLKSKLDPKKFAGFGDAQWVMDEDFAKLFEGLKDE